MKPIRLLIAAVALLIAGLSGAARADSVLLLSQDYMVGTTASLDQNSFVLAGPGELSITLLDLDFPQALAALSFELNGPLGQAGAGSGENTFTLNVIAGTYFLLTSGRALAVSDANPWGSGRYSVSVMFSPLVPTEIPVPPALLLFGSGLAMLAVRRRNRPTAAIKL